MRYGLAAWGLREESLDSQLKITRENGLELLEFSIANYGKDVLQLGASASEIAEVKQAFADAGVKLECGCTGNDFTNDDVAGQVTKVKEVIGIASKLGIRLLRIFAGFNSDSVVCGKKFEKMIAALAEVQKSAEAAGITLCVETHGGVSCLENGALLHFNSVSTRIDHWKKILETGVSITYDPANLSAVGSSDPVAFHRQFSARIPYIHLKDFRDVEGGIVPAACGEGRLDWDSLMAELKNCSCPAMIEYELPEDVRDGMSRSLKFLRRFQ